MIIAIAFLIVYIAALYQTSKTIELKRALDRQAALTRLWQGNYQLLKATLNKPSGQMGLMGESGPEEIMPLTRDATSALDGQPRH